MKYIIRPSILSDKEVVNAAHVKSIREICIKDYRQDQVDGWSALVYTDDVWHDSVNIKLYLLMKLLRVFVILKFIQIILVKLWVFNWHQMPWERIL